ncbi:hypothetical protein [Halorussus sp. MSC15.2]|uniref:DUF7286 family protein n=1 Tax=Halorussus sp. MSC15.2 TaxID=2283638 RepID=UPI0013CF67BB|nr:hypothetical protein [Halorussus sp. MSC15.2]NEU57538.1 hypothetical protein [Halorussus sp. MSC15.2]
MNLAADRRARVPFALVGVLLLVGSAGLSATLAGGPTPRTDDSVGVAVDRATAATGTALRGAIARAGRQAARGPVTDPANTTAGRVLNDSTPYRDSLRIRIYLAARDALTSVKVHAGGSRSPGGGVTATVSLPPIRNASDLRDAKRRVKIEPAGGAESAENAGLRVRIANVTATATRDGRVVEREQFSPALVVATPALALHERTERFETRLNRGPLAPGLGRRLTTRLYALAWVRGYAQYGRAPIENVVANRHVELAANGGVLREQRAAFGRSDPRGRRALGWATARVGVTDLLTAANARRGTARTDQLLAAAKDYQKRNPMPGGLTRDRNTSESKLRVGVNRTADRAFAGLVTGENGTDLTGVLRSAYTADARLVASVRKSDTEGDRNPSPDSPGPNWTLQSSEVRTTTGVESATGPPPGVPQGWHLLRYESRRVVRTSSLVADWVRGNETRRTVQRWTESFAVSVGVSGDHGEAVRVTPSVPAPPARPVAGVHERGGALDGPNFRDLSAKATERLVADRGGFDALARRAVVGTLDTRSKRVVGRRPPDLRTWVYRDLAALRERVRNLSVAVARARTLGGAPPAAELAETLRSRRTELLDAPARYDGVADRARVAARAAYLDRVVARLESRADRTNATRSAVGRVLADAGSSMDRAHRILRTQMRSRASPSSLFRTPPARAMPADGPGRATNLTVEGAPPYLTLAALDHEQVTAIPEGERDHPLAAENENVFAIPYGDAAETVASELVGGGESDRADLRTAALALRAANRTLAETDNRSLVHRRNELQSSLAASMQTARERLVEELSMPRFDLTEAERRAAVDSGLTRWNTTAGRALAVANGSAAQAVSAAVVRRRSALRQPVRRDWVRLRAELAVESVRRSVAGPPRSQVNRTGTATRSVAKTALKQAVTTGLGNATEVASKRWFGEVLGAVPAGLPVAPVPGYWYATLNVWTVSVRGQYARFAVTAPQGPPGESVSYVRESATVRLDWDDDGESEVVGRTTPVSFETETTVVVVVPPGPPGVGDRDGNRDETSPGWSSG